MWELPQPWTGEWQSLLFRPIHGLLLNSAQCLWITLLRATAVIPKNMESNLAIALWLGPQCIKWFFTWTFLIFWRLVETSMYWTRRGKYKTATVVFFRRFTIPWSHLVLPSSTLFSAGLSPLLKSCTHGKGFFFFVVEKEDVDSVMDCGANQIRCVWKPFPFGVKLRQP